MKAGDAAKDIQPGRRVATNLDLGFNGAVRVEGLIEEIAYDACLRRVAGSPDIVDGEVVIDAHVALDEASHLPRLVAAIEAFEDQDVAATGRTAIALATALLIGVSEGCAHRIAQRLGVTLLGRADAVRQTSFFHAASCPTA